MNNVTLKQILLFSLLLLGGWSIAAAQQGRRLTLKRCIEIAQKESPAARIAKKNFQASYWSFKSFKADYKPQLRFAGNTPNFSRSIVSNFQDDGTQEFVSQNFSSSFGNVILEQIIAPTGGSISLNSSANQIIQFGSNYYQRWNATPIALTINQPLGGYNGDKWRRKLEPMRYDIAEIRYMEALEETAIDLTGRYFDVYIAQIEIANAEKNLAINDSIYTISKGRFRVGKIAENDLLQTELAYMRARSSLQTAELNYARNLRALLNALGWFQESTVELAPPPELMEFQIDEEFAVMHALQTRSEILDNEIRALEAESGVAQAKWSNGFSANLSGSVGLVQSGDAVQDAYRNPQDQQSANLSLNIPLFQWGKNKAEVEIARANQERTMIEVEVGFYRLQQEVTNQILNFRQLQNQIEIAAKSDTIAQRRFEVAKNRYLVGKIDITNLQIAQQEKDQSRTNFIRTLKEYWVAYYQLRRSTLYDFLRRRTLQPPRLDLR